MQKKIKTELKNKSFTELTAELIKSKAIVAKRRMEIRTGKSKNTNLSRLLDDCAVISTLLQHKTDKENRP